MPSARGAEPGLGGRRRVRPGLVVAGLAGAGAGLAVIGSVMPSAATTIVGGNRPVDAEAGDTTSFMAHNSPAIARNPRRPANLVVANRIDKPSFSCALHVSFDHGATWRRSHVPFPAGEEAPPRCYAPDVGFGPDAALYLSFVTLKGPGNVPNAAWLVTSNDGGRTLSAPARVLGPLAFQVRLVADPRQPGRLYLSWLQAEQTATLAFPMAGNPIRFRRSDDAGKTWTDPVTVSGSGRLRVVAPSVAVGAGKHIYVVYLDLGGDRLDYHGGHAGRGGDPYPGRWRLVVARSPDGGATWSESVVETDVVPTRRFVVFLPPYPSLAVDRESGRIYVSFEDGRLGDADVWVWVSTDGGRSFARPHRVNDTPARDNTSQYLPELSVAPNGRLDVVYFDRRADPGDVRNEVSLQSSSDGGSTFSRRVRVSDRSFDSGVGFGSEKGLADLGSRLGLDSLERRALAVWADTRAGTRATSKQDIASAVVSFDSASALRAPLQIAGAVLIGAAFVVVLRRRTRQGMGEWQPSGA